MTPQAPAINEELRAAVLEACERGLELMREERRARRLVAKRRLPDGSPLRVFKDRYGRFSVVDAITDGCPIGYPVNTTAAAIIEWARL